MDGYELSSTSAMATTTVHMEMELQSGDRMVTVDKATGAIPKSYARRSHLPPVPGAPVFSPVIPEGSMYNPVSTLKMAPVSVTANYHAPICSTVPLDMHLQFTKEPYLFGDATTCPITTISYVTTSSPVFNLAQTPLVPQSLSSTPINYSHTPTFANEPVFTERPMTFITGKYFPEIGPFDIGGVETLSEYLKRFEHFCFNKYGPDKQQWVGVLENKMKDKLLTCYRMNGGNTVSYDLIKNELLNYYNVNRELGNIQPLNFAAAKYDEGSIYDYMAKLKFLFKKSYPNENSETSSILYEKFRDTIPDKIRKLITSKYFEMRSLFNIQMTFSSLQNFVLSLETQSENELPSSVASAYTYVDENKTKHRTIDRPVINLRKGSLTNKSPNKDIDKCEYCSRSGHSLDNCYRKLGLCFRCGSSGHLMVMCTKNENKNREKQGTPSNIICQICEKGGHVAKSCWVLYPELRPKTRKENKNEEIVTKSEN